MGRGSRSAVAATAGAALRPLPAARPARPGSQYVHDRAVSLAELAGAHGMDTGVWFHVTPAERASALRADGILACGNVPDPGAQASWVDPASVYVWPTVAAARAWIDFRRDNGYGGRREDRYEILAVNARADELRVCPDSEMFGNLLAHWGAERHCGDGWPTGEELTDDLVFHRDTLDIAGADGVTLADWLDEHGDTHFFAEPDEHDDPDADDGDAALDERVIAIGMLRALPDTLRDALCRHYAEHGHGLMLTDVNIGASRVCRITD